MKTVFCEVCNKTIKRRERDLLRYTRFYCSVKCQSEGKKVEHIVNCEHCGKQFKPSKRRIRFCSRRCSNKNRTGIRYKTSSYISKSKNRIEVLKKAFNFTTCMVKGCSYNRTFDIHRFVSGKDGGKYEIGNMYAICPNHHTEFYRGLITLMKESDCILMAQDVGVVGTLASPTVSKIVIP